MNWAAIFLFPLSSSKPYVGTWKTMFKILSWPCSILIELFKATSVVPHKIKHWQRKRNETVQWIRKQLRAKETFTRSWGKGAHEGWFRRLYAQVHTSKSWNRAGTAEEVLYCQRCCPSDELWNEQTYKLGAREHTLASPTSPAI